MDLLEGLLEREIASGWGKTKLRRYRCSQGQTVVALPHLSTFKLMSRGVCVDDVRGIYNNELGDSCA